MLGVLVLHLHCDVVRPRGQDESHDFIGLAVVEAVQVGREIPVKLTMAHVDGVLWSRSISLCSTIRCRFTLDPLDEWQGSAVVGIEVADGWRP